MEQRQQQEEPPQQQQQQQQENAMPAVNAASSRGNAFSRLMASARTQASNPVQQPTSNWGGSRAGAGRPSNPDKPEKKT
jgi:hypothetical protein